jgi:hypothetical protein
LGQQFWDITVYHWISSSGIGRCIFGPAVLGYFGVSLGQQFRDTTMYFGGQQFWDMTVYHWISSSGMRRGIAGQIFHDVSKKGCALTLGQKKVRI